MQEVIKETITQQSDGGVSTVAKQVVRDTQTQTIASVIYFITGLLEIALSFRFVLKISGANPNSGFVSGIYAFTQLLILPFQEIFSPAASTGIEVRALFEPATLVAMLVYAVLAWGVIKLVAILAGQSKEEL